MEIASFDQQKKDVLSRVDKSFKGSIDAPILHVIDRINEFDDYYTCSSCSGRIMLLEVAQTKRKDLSEWKFVSHEGISFEQLKESLNEISEQDVWFKQEPLIVHVCCRSLDCAKSLIACAHRAGLKRAAITTLSKRIMVEILGTDRIDTIISRREGLLVSESYLRVLVDEANKKLENNQKKIERFFCELELFGTRL